jgi:carbohydrate kinase (thermoresistant glucokinase family)
MIETTRQGLVIVVMGVSGSGKSTFGSALAATRNAPFIEGDAFHPKDNIKKMASSVALTDHDRYPWLEALGRAATAQRRSQGLVLACSALKRSYRDHLRSLIGEPLLFVYLRVDPATLRDRVQARTGHYMPPELLNSQLATLELPAPEEHALELPVAPITQMVWAIEQHLASFGRDA